MKSILVYVGLTAFGIVASTVAPASGRYDFGYQISQGDAVGIARAFDDGKNTVIAFNDLAAVKPTITTVDGTPVRYRAVTNYAVLPGIQHDLLVYGSGKVASIHYGDAAISPKAIASRSAAWDTAMDLEIQRQAQLHDLAATKPATPVAAASAKPAPVTPATPAATTSSSAVSTSRPASSPPTKDAQGPLAKALPWTPVATSSSPAPAAAQAPPWTVRHGQHLREVVANWSERAGWVVYWDPSALAPEDDYALEVPNTFNGSFETAIKGLFRALPPELALRVELRTANSPHLLLITANRGNP